MRYYVYRHTRPDTNEVFYIGVGTKPLNHDTWRKEFKRAYSMSNRSLHWRNINSLIQKEVEIVMEFENYQDAKNKEIELITLYGRRDLGKGTLVNFTDGGDGTEGMIPWNKGKTNIYSKQTLDKMRDVRLGKPYNGDRANLRKATSKPVQEYRGNLLTNTFGSAREAGRTIGVDSGVISAVCRNNKLGKNYTYKGLKYIYIEK